MHFIGLQKLSEFHESTVAQQQRAFSMKIKTKFNSTIKAKNKGKVNRAGWKRGKFKIDRKR